MSDNNNPRTRNYYQKEYKLYIVGMLTNYSVKEVSASFNLPESLIYRWRAKYSVEAGLDSTTTIVNNKTSLSKLDSVKIPEPNLEVFELRKQVKELNDVITVLKKTLQIMSK